MPKVSISWNSSGKPIPGFKALGSHDFRTESVKRLLAEHDFLLTVEPLSKCPLDNHFNWDRVADQVALAIESDYSSNLGE